MWTADYGLGIKYGLRTTHFAHFGLESGMVFRGNYYFVAVVEESCFVVLISHWKLFTKIRNPKLVPGAK